MATQWFYRMFGEEFGPIEEPALQEMRESGTLGPEDEIRREGSARWQTLAACFPAGGVATEIEQSSRELEVQDSGDDDPVWYCLTTGQELGPLSFHELHDLAEQGILTAEDQVKLGVKGKYRRAGSMGRLAAVMDYQAIERPSPAATAQAPAESQAVSSPPEPPATVEAPVYTYLPGAEELTWYAWIRGVECGPVNLVQLAQWLQAGQIGPTDFVKYGSYGAWLPPTPTIEQSLRQFVVVQAAPVPPKAAPAKPSVEPAKPAVEATKSKPAEPASTAKAATSLAETQPITKKGTDPAIETKPTASPVEAAKPIAPIPKPDPEPVRSYSSPNPSGGFSSPMSAAMRTPPKPAAKKKSGGGGGGGGGGGVDLGALFANPMVVKGGGGVAVVALLVAGFMFMPAGTGAERADYEVLSKILVDFRKLRDDKADDAAFNKFAEEAKKNAKPVIDRLKPIASAKRRDRQFLLWAARDRLPGMLIDARQEPSVAESEYEYNVMSAAFILRLGPDPKTVKRIEPVATKGKAPPVVD